MSDLISIKVDKLSKSFRLPHEKNSSIKGAFINIFHGKRTFEIQKALREISFEVKKGEFFGIVGRNGSGKSTLLKILAETYVPTSGKVEINGSLTPFIELGVGFNPELTGRDNVFMNGALLGFSRMEMAKMYDEIVEFAELERFMDQKLKNYSSGMQVRLAFSIAIKSNSDILLLDEVLAVGDADFQKKCFNYFRELKKNKKTVVFISHDMTAIREYCDRAALIESGKIMKIGSADKISQEYVKMFMKNTTGVKAGDKNNRWGTGDASIDSVKPVLNKKQLIVDVAYSFNRDISRPIFGLTIVNAMGIKIFESNTLWNRIKTGDYKEGSSCKVHWEIPNVFTNGNNYISAAISDTDGVEFYDWWDEAATFEVDKDMITTGVILPDHKVIIT